MLAVERRQSIIDIVEEKKKVLVGEIALRFSVTEETIRRDLEILENQGVLKRTYGGAILNQGTNVDYPLSMREVSNKNAKTIIAEEVAKVVQEGDTLMLDSSSTALYVAKYIKISKKKVTIITNSFRIITELQDSNDINLILAGGSFRDSSKAFVGKWTENIIKNYYVNKAIICCKGLDINRGIMDSNELEAEVKFLMAKSAEEVFLVIDSMKFDKISFVKIMDIGEVHYVYTDKVLNKQWKDFFNENKVKINLCGK